MYARIFNKFFAIARDKLFELYAASILKTKIFVFFVISFFNSFILLKILFYHAIP